MVPFIRAGMCLLCLTLSTQWLAQGLEHLKTPNFIKWMNEYMHACMNEWTNEWILRCLFFIFVPKVSLAVSPFAHHPPFSHLFKPCNDLGLVPELRLCQMALFWATRCLYPRYDPEAASIMGALVGEGAILKHWAVTLACSRSTLRKLKPESMYETWVSTLDRARSWGSIGGYRVKSWKHPTLLFLMTHL